MYNCCTIEKKPASGVGGIINTIFAIPRGEHFGKNDYFTGRSSLINTLDFLGRHQQKLQLRSKLETYYTAFGLTMQGISDKAIKTNYAENKYRYNQGTELQNKEFSDGTGWEMYETGYRSLDPQLGRFTQIDPLIDRTHFFSAYQYAANNPIQANDPTGLKQQNPQTIHELQNIMNSGGGGGPAVFEPDDFEIDDIYTAAAADPCVLSSDDYSHAFADQLNAALNSACQGGVNQGQGTINAGNEGGAVANSDQTEFDGDYGTNQFDY